MGYWALSDEIVRLLAALRAVHTSKRKHLFLLFAIVFQNAKSLSSRNRVALPEMFNRATQVEKYKTGNLMLIE